MKLMVLAVGIAATLALTAPGATTYYVATNGVDNADDGRGLSWDKPYATISNAVAQANKSADNTVLISNGVYSITAQIVVTTSVTCRGASGDPRDVIVNGSATVRGFYLNSGTATSVLAAVTVTNGYAASDSGGVLCAGIGVVSNCIITGNTGLNGGGVRLLAGGGVGTDSSLVGNAAPANNGRGGGAHLLDGRLVRTLVQGNRAGEQGGGLFLSGSPTVADCTIVQNAITNDTIFIYGGGIRDNSAGTIVGCWIVSNALAGTNTGNGGGAHLYAALSSYSNCVFAYNTITNATGSAGAAGGGVYITQAASSNRFVNCLVYGNRAKIQGGGVHLFQGQSKFINCTVSRNAADSSVGGVQPRNDAVTNLLVNCIVYGNSAPSGSNYMLFANMTASNTCAAPLLAGSGNTATNPAFAAPAADNFRLAAGSPCLDAGLTEDWLRDTRDLDGHARVDRFSGRVDMGAYEFVPGGMMTLFR